jgi:hypothetical protein
MARAMVRTAPPHGRRHTASAMEEGAPVGELPPALRGADADVARARLSGRLRVQGRSAAQLGSPLYADLLPRIADDVAAGGPCWAVLQHFADEPTSAAVSLRFMAAVHRLVLRRQAPELAMHYPSVGGQAGVDGAWAAFTGVVERRR